MDKLKLRNTTKFTSLFMHNKVIHCKVNILWIENLKYSHNMGSITSIMYYSKFNYYDKIENYKLTIWSRE